MSSDRSLDREQFEQLIEWMYDREEERILALGRARTREQSEAAGRRGRVGDLGRQIRELVGRAVD